MEIPKEKFENVKAKAEEFYKSIDKVRCPYLNDEVSFNAKGLDHIKFKRFGKSRSNMDQYMRLRLIKLAPIVLKKSHTLQEFFETKSFERIRSNTRWEKKMVIVKYYGFVSIVNQSRVKIIVKEVDGAQDFFGVLYHSGK